MREHFELMETHVGLAHTLTSQDSEHGHQHLCGSAHRLACPTSICEPSHHPRQHVSEPCAREEKAGGRQSSWDSLTSEAEPALKSFWGTVWGLTYE